MTIFPSYRRSFTLWGLTAIWLFISSNVVADADENAIDPVLQKIEAAEYSPYADNDPCDDDASDDDALPDNVIEQLYGNARMAFLFGQFEIAFKAWQPLAENGYAKAQAALAWMYHTGNGVPKNVQIAFEWYLKAANKGHEYSAFLVGYFYCRGIGVTADPIKANEWLAKSKRDAKCN